MRENLSRTEAVRQRAAGQWTSILPAVAGIDAAILDSKHHPCPKCGGSDRFRYVDAQAGACFCNQCFSEKCGDGFAAIQWMTSCTFPEAVSRVATYLGMDNNGNGTGTGAPPRSSSARTKASTGAGSRSKGKAGGSTYRTLAEAIEAARPVRYDDGATPWKLTGDWTYHDRSGAEVMHVLRFDSETGLASEPIRKTYRPLAAVPGGWKLGDPEGALLLYRLPEVLASTGRIYITEGEKASDAGARIGLVTTTSAHGSAAAKKTDWGPLAGREDIVILPDNDPAGARYAEEVQGILAGLTPSARASIVKLPGVPPAGDLFDFLEARDAQDPETLRAEVERIVEAARVESIPLAFRPLSLADLAALPPPTWLVRDLLPAGGFCCLFGPEGCGKSFVALDVALRIAAGFGWYGHPCNQGLVVYCAGEGVSSIYRRVQAWQSQFHDDGNPPELGAFFVMRDVPRVLEEGIAGLRKGLEVLPERPRLVVVDTLARAMVGGDENSVKDMGVAVDRLAPLSRDLGATILLLHHARKDGGAIRGSSALPGALDATVEAAMADGIVTLSNRKQKDAALLAPMSLKLIPVPLGVDPDGAAVSSCYVAPRSGVDLAAETAGVARQILEFLSGPSVGEEGATRATILKAYPKMVVRTFHDAVNRLMRDLQVERVPGKQRYRKKEGN